MGWIIKRIWYRAWRAVIVTYYRIAGPPSVLRFKPRLNRDILIAFGAKVSTTRVRIHPMVTLHEVKDGYANLEIASGCILNGNNYLDLSAKIILEEGVSLGPGVTIMTHNRYNYNRLLEKRLAHTCGRMDVTIRKGAGIKANATVTMGVTIGENTVVGAGAVVNRDVPDLTFVGGVPARVISEINETSD